MDVTRHNADFACVRRNHARAVRPDQRGFGALKRTLHTHHIQHRNAFGNANDQLELCVDSFKNGIGCKWWRYIDRRSIRASHMTGFVHGVENWQTNVGLPTFARRHTTNHFGAVGNSLFGVESTL